MALRCFIAIEIPDTIRRSIDDSITALKKSGAEVKWVARENIHLTVQFLGETEESLIPKIKEALDKKLSPYSPFYIRISDVGCFPDRKRPRVIWVGVEESSPLMDLYKDIANAMEAFGYKQEERAFTPHITIGRVKSGKNMRELLVRLDEVGAIRFSDFEVLNITLMKSELKPSGAKYDSLAEIPFGRRSNGD